MHSILEQIVADTYRRVEAAKQAAAEGDGDRDKDGMGTVHVSPAPGSLSTRSAAPIRRTHEPSPFRPPFSAALAAPGLSFICEVKKASPSKGVIAEDFDHLGIARSYEEAGAAAISVLTEPNFFQGSPRYLAEIAAAVNVPALRKDFIIDAYQIHEAASLGAAAVLLIVALLSDEQLAAFIAYAHSLGMDALVEAHTREELERALAAGAGIVGVNNRDLHSFEVDLSLSVRLREVVPSDVLYVAESGIRTLDDVALLARAGVDAVLIGETLMRSNSRAALLAQMREASQ
jgi:indole-3-glycerol phosphate synthase